MPEKKAAVGTKVYIEFENAYIDKQNRNRGNISKYNIVQISISK